MISRIWHGYTTKANADLYEQLVQQEIFPEIENKKIQGYKGIQLLRRELNAEVEFTTLMWFDNIESVKALAGEEYETAYVPEKARQILSRFDAECTHSELRHNSL